MTSQVLAVLNFLYINRDKKDARLTRLISWKSHRLLGRLPGLGIMINRCRNGLFKVKLDIRNHKSYISELTKEEKIFPIL